jgi:hypothetical protein|tara:strand:+ start:1865 stop:2077 length:213 start_codon:yes stop_codon:yes gene_type:complete
MKNVIPSMRDKTPRMSNFVSSSSVSTKGPSLKAETPKMPTVSKGTASVNHGRSVGSPHAPGAPAKPARLS